MTIDEYMTAAYVTAAEMAKALGVSRQTVNNWRSGRSIPLADVAARVERVTLGAVKASGWVRT